jgi:ketosteroid isomerase-like protein
VTQQKAVVETYTDGFRTGDLEKILACLTGDVVWELHGAKTVVGKDAFATEADSAGGSNPQLTLDRLVEDGDVVGVLGHGSVEFGNGDLVDFTYAEVFTFTDGLVSRLDTFHVWLGEVPET